MRREQISTLRDGALAAASLLVAKAPLWVMYATALVVNLRYVIYSAVLAPHFEHLSRPWRALLSYITVDGMFALFVGRFHRGEAAAESRAARGDRRGHRGRARGRAIRRSESGEGVAWQTKPGWDGR